MPWRKYPKRPGKYGLKYHVSKGIQVRKDHRGLWTVFFEKQGIRKNQTFTGDRKGLTEAIRTAEALARNSDELIKQLGAVKVDKAPSFIEFSGQWFQRGLSRWSEFTEQRYEQVLRLYIEPRRLFRKPITAIKRQEIKKFLHRITKRRSPALVETVHGVISAVFSEAIDDEIIDANPSSGLLKGILPPKHKRDLKAPDPFSRNDLRLFLSCAEAECSASELMVLKCMAYAGLRLGEALAMKIEYLDFGRKTYFVAESYKTYRFGRPKSGRFRLVDLPEFLVEALSRHVAYLRRQILKKGQGGQIDLLFVDPSEKGHWPYSQRKIQNLMKRLCKKARLRIRNPHDLRHTYATLLLMAHQSPGYVQWQLGHSSISITMDIYCHWLSGEGREGLEAALGGGDFAPNRVQKSHIIAYDKKRLQ